MTSRLSRQSSLHEFYNSQNEDEDEEEKKDDRTQKALLKAFNLKLTKQDGFHKARKVKTTEFSDAASLAQRLQAWVKPPYSWCQVSLRHCQPGGGPLCFRRKSKPFQQIKAELEEEKEGAEELDKHLFELLIFFQEKSLFRIENYTALKKAQVASRFLEQIHFSRVRPKLLEHRNHSGRLQAMVMASPKYMVRPTQSKHEKKMQEKFRKVEKMLDTYDFSMNKACKEAKVSKQTVKKWLKKRQSKGLSLVYKAPRVQPSSHKERCWLMVQKYIDDHHGNVFIKDIQQHLVAKGKDLIPESTHGYWIKKNIGYTYKKAATVSPDLSKVLFVQHQVKVAETVRDVEKLGLFIVYIDESSFTRNEGKQYGFGPRGQRVEFREHKPAYSIGCLAAISKRGLEGLQLRDGPTSKHAFVHFVLELMKRLSSDHFVFGRIVFYLDNAQYHVTPDVLDLFDMLDVSYIFAPAYASPLNPIEYYFGVVKKRLRHRVITNK